MPKSSIDLKAITEQTRTFSTQALQKHQLGYPSEHVVRFLQRFFGHNKASDSSKQGLDIGYGSGQHLKLMMDYNLTAHGIELIPDAAESMRTHFSNTTLLGELWQGDFAGLPLPNNYYDAIVSWGVSFLKPIDAMKMDLTFIHSLLNDKGYLCLNFRTPDTWFYGLGEEIAPKHFLLDARAGEYAGAHYTFLNAEETQQIIENAGFDIINFERYDWWKNKLEEQHSWWIVWAQKSSSK